MIDSQADLSIVYIPTNLKRILKYTIDFLFIILNNKIKAYYYAVLSKSWKKKF